MRHLSSFCPSGLTWRSLLIDIWQLWHTNVHVADVFFICILGMEVASYFSDKAASVAMVGTTQYPFERTLGSEIGQLSMQVRDYDDNSFQCYSFGFFLINIIKTQFFTFRCWKKKMWSSTWTIESPRSEERMGRYLCLPLFSWRTVWLMIVEQEYLSPAALVTKIKHQPSWYRL